MNSSVEIKMRLANVCLLILWCAINVEAAKILCFFSFPAVSHQNFYRPIWTALAHRGHDIVVITTDPVKNMSLPNLKQIDLSSSYDIIRANPVQNTMSIDQPIYARELSALNLVTEIVEYQLEHPKVVNLLNDSKFEFDLIVVENFSPLVYGLGYFYNAPVIGTSSLGTFLHGYDAIGNTIHPLINPDLWLGYDSKQDFWQRWKSTTQAVVYYYFYNFHHLPRADEIARRIFGQNMPYLGSLEKNMSLYLMGENPIIYEPKPAVPASVRIHNLHLQPVKPLPKDLEKFLNNAEEGVIYFSLGSNVKSADLGEHIIKIVTSALRELPYKILWKFEADNLPDKPPNVLIRKWCPQQDLLAHRNLKAFVTQGGLQSVEEAIDREVPLIMIPFIGDQLLNSNRLARVGVGITLNKDELTKDMLKNAILDVAQNERYRLNVRKVKNLLNDEPMTGIEKAVWWCEYVIRHDGARHLRSPILDVPLYQYFLLDVIGATLLVGVSSVYLMSRIAIFIFKLIFTKRIKVKVS